ncbi:MAG: pyruvate, phosphate dikinase [Oscillospiraceae bacterium]|nr:pyruvate, phosphate dikinase [Oscillospiraceae bacterium]
MSTKYVYLFSEGNAKMRDLLGGKGANLAEMTGLGMPVPQGFTVTTEACTRYYDDGKKIDSAIEAEIFKNVLALEEISGKKFGDNENPMLLAVRSGARASMPGMMDTVLNLGLNDIAVEGLAKRTSNPRFAYDSYRRFIQMFADVVMEVPKSSFEKIIDEMKEEKGIKEDVEFTADCLKEMVVKFKAYFKEQKGFDFPQDPNVQLIEAITAVFRSWDNPRANYYRMMHGIPYSWGTAVNVQIMVFGNTGNKSGSGVAFSRNPATGEKKIYGEYLLNAQGEDVVAGIRTPDPMENLKTTMPEVYNQFVANATKLEQHYKDMQDMEFTIEDGKLFMLQTRNGKRTAAAALRVAVELVEEGMIDKKQAVLMLDPSQLDTLLHPQFDEAALKAAKPIGQGLAASPGAASGRVVFSADDAVEWTGRGETVILTRMETSPEDIAGMDCAAGILTARGGMTSHAAVVARGWGRCCVAGCGDIVLNEEGKFFTLGGKTIKEGDYISINGSTGYVYDESIPTVEAEIGGHFSTIMGWADEFRQLEIRTNADTPEDAATAISFGAKGIGLTRTEHMFFEADRIMPMREMILSTSLEQRKAALDKLLPMQRGDFEGIYEAMQGYPVTIRFLDPPLHEFLPQNDSDIKKLAEEMGITFDQIKNVIDSLHEFNPMMGFRGCRLAVRYPEIAEMQTRAVIEAAINVQGKHPEWNIVPEIMIPLPGEAKEFKFVKDIVVATADKIIKEKGSSLKYMVGTMMEIPRACLTADEVAKEAEFFSFGTNDLTQMTFGFSRDDAGNFLNTYYENKIYETDPFQRLDQTGVGKLVEMAVKLGKEARPELKLGVCGEHGGDPSSIEFFHKVGLAYVSCSPFRVPIARLAAAQSAIRNPR